MMSEDRVIGQFDVTLSEDLVKDVQTTGRPVKTEIWEQGEGKRGLVGCIFVDKNEQDVVRLRVTVFNQPGEGTSEEGTSTSVSTAAVSTTVSTTTETAEHAASQSQTDHSGAIPTQGEMADQSTQAAQEMDEKRQQTEQQAVDQQGSQTDKVGQDQKQIQTEPKGSAGKMTQTTVLSFNDSGAQAVQHTKESNMQTDIKTLREGMAQTTIKTYATSALQTDPKVVRQFALQTDQWIGTHQCLQVCPDLVESAFQTDPKPTSVSVVQTEIDTDEKFMQTENPIAEKAIQTRVLTQVKAQQTDPPPVYSTSVQTEPPPQMSTEMQTTRDYLVDLPSQTEDVIVIDPEEQCENDCQTDFVRVIDPRNELSVECQTDPCKVIYLDQYVDSDLQTDGVKIINPEEMNELEMQTDDVYIRELYYQSEVEIQTEDVAFKEPIETIDTEAQTNLVWIFGLSQAPETEVIEENKEEQNNAPADVNQVPEGGDVPQDGEVPQVGEVLQPSEVPQPGEVVTAPAEVPPGEMAPEQSMEDVKKSMESNIILGGPVSAEDAQPPAGTDISEDQDTQKGIQTDPVTIIIGDSSFLVNKLKVYAQREMRFMEGNRGSGRRGGPRTRGRGRGRGQYTGPPALTQPGAVPTTDGADKDMPVLDAESTPRATAAQVNRTPMSAPPATRRPFTGLRHRTSPQDIRDICKTPETKGRFNCPFCTNVFNDSAALYKHLREEHGSPRASNRRRRRKGTILIAEDGSLITDDGTIEIPPLKKDVPLGPIRANNIKKSDSAIKHEQHMAKMRALANTQSLKTTGVLPGADGSDYMMANIKAPPEDDEDEEDEEVVSNGAPSAAEASDAPQVGQRAFSCPFCPKLFTKSSALYIHLQNAHKAVKSRPAPKARVKQQQEVDMDEELVEEYDEDQELVHEEEVELVVPAGAAQLKAEEYGTEEGEIPLEEAVVAKHEEGEVQLEQEEGEVQLEAQYEHTEVHLLQGTEEVVQEEVVQEEIITETTEEGEIPLEQVVEHETIIQHIVPEVESEVQTVQEVVTEVEPEEGEVPIDEEQVITKQEPEVDEEQEEVAGEAGDKQPARRGRVRTRGGGMSKGRGAATGAAAAAAAGDRGTKRRRTPEDDDEEMPKLTRVTRRSVQLESPTRSTRRGPKILSPAKRGRR